MPDIQLHQIDTKDEVLYPIKCYGYAAKPIDNSNKIVIWWLDEQFKNHSMLVDSVPEMNLIQSSFVSVLVHGFGDYSVTSR